MWGAPGSGFLSPNNIEPGIGHHSLHGHRVRVRRDEVPVLGLVAFGPTAPGIVARSLALLDRAGYNTAAGAVPVAAESGERRVIGGRCGGADVAATP